MKETALIQHFELPFKHFNVLGLPALLVHCIFNATKSALGTGFFLRQMHNMVSYSPSFIDCVSQNTPVEIQCWYDHKDMTDLSEMIPDIHLPQI